ncbi:Plant lipid transfer protein/Par allergen [Macleaya cordata]|uniref:Non-specific lipid-transfer protein n=1 Tax=Macleaya cordata TaxID=56857 RepID=A0A200PUR4_MACCD|nr:Plant lipid transfer protein/Par allergen [Macleaya cordata]
MAAPPSCNTVLNDLSPCLSYLSDKDPINLSTSCCHGIKELDKVVLEKKDRVTVCECIKSVLPEIGTIDNSRVQILLTKCGTKHKFLPRISSNMNCTK